MLDLLVRGRHLVLTTALDHAEVARRLQREIAPPAWQWNERRPQLFEGRFDGEHFSMVRLVRGRNSFRPVIQGQLLAAPVGTRVDVTLRAHPVALALSGVLAVLGGGVVGLLWKEWMQSGALPLPALPLAGLPALPVFGLAALATEARKATRMLEALVGANERPG